MAGHIIAVEVADTRKSGTLTIISIWVRPVQINPNDIVLSELNVLGTICYTPQASPT